MLMIAYISVFLFMRLYNARSVEPRQQIFTRHLNKVKKKLITRSSGSRARMARFMLIAQMSAI